MHTQCTLVFLPIYWICCTFAPSNHKSSNMKKPASILLTVLSFLSVLCTMSCRRAIVAEGYQHTIVDTLGDFVVSYDTLYIDPSLLTPNTCLNIRSVVRYHDRYYCYCEEEESLCARIATEEHLFSFTTDGRDFWESTASSLSCRSIKITSLL